MGLYYGFWNIMLLFPRAIRLSIEVFVIALFVVFLWPIDKYFFNILIQCIRGLNYLILGGIRFILPVFPVGRKYIWDEKIAKRGKQNNIWLQGKLDEIQKSKARDVFHKKTVWIIVSCFCVGAFLPFFNLEKFIPEHYTDRLYSINHFLTGIETKLTAGIENYPPFWIMEKEVEAEPAEYAVDIQIEEEMEPVYLKLNEETTYANIRADAGMHGDALCIISKEDEMIYQYVYEYDSERYWLKVSLPDYDNLEGWISSNVIDPEIIDVLDLQN